MIGAVEGDVFAVAVEANMVILKKLEMPSKEEILARFHMRAAENQKRVEARGIKESDVPEIIHHFRRRAQKE